MIRNTQLHIILLTSPTSQQWRNTVGGLLRGQVSAPVFLLQEQKGHNYIAWCFTYYFAKANLFLENIAY